MVERSSISSRSAGFTLIEVIMTLVVVGVLATIGATVISGGFRNYFLGREIARDDAQGRLALERMSRELRAVRSTADLNIAVANQVSFTHLDGTAIAYRRNAVTSQLERSQNGVAGTYQPLADNVSALTISYLQNDGVTPETTTPGLVYYITVQLTISTQNVNAGYRGTFKPVVF